MSADSFRSAGVFEVKKYKEETLQISVSRLFSFRGGFLSAKYIMRKPGTSVLADTFRSAVVFEVKQIQ